ncbi:phosphopantetheinyltransferase component of enterobactin synthase multienzyme complex [Serratia rubidaea]|nr:4'-phosphopantetheinyl transferase superfamily protein [Serratia rubidaea]QPR62371.1 4'-phosphopantetheinyl transferase superfamily protein [Serratia rubidaea]CAI0852060.1 phosphopantetheinyltransferase component of enterobactin synthase multienzyme complex [Serratia rubidaea]CAI1658601.1 phosphopantetheinyltransferase component of enterobactin synthase multienzyme complex [Serratia rubidaea]HAY0639242.1 4'-phosphopantetheinyl transferase superfamily protein [Serratia rubidaea]
MTHRFFAARGAHRPTLCFPWCEEGYIAALPTITYCRLTFDAAYYHDRQFTRCRIPLPTWLSGMPTARKADYLAGRYCARRALMCLGAHVTDVGVHLGRVPRWPEGFIGSISHSAKRAIALATNDARIRHLGVDTERHQPEAMREIAEMLASHAEAQYIARLPLAREWVLTLLFSAKESLFKALYPALQRDFDFMAAELAALAPAERRFTLRLTVTLSAHFKAGDCFDGYFSEDGDHLTTLVVVRQ